MNRPVSRGIELATGMAVDQYGKLITDDVRNGLSIAARVTGLRPMNEQRKMELEYRQRQTEYSQNEMRARLRSTLRSMFRSGNITGPKLKKAVLDYIESGGKPEYFTQFLQEQMLAGTVPKFDEKMRDLLSSKAGDELLRFIKINRMDDADNIVID